MRTIGLSSLLLLALVSPLTAQQRTKVKPASPVDTTPTMSAVGDYTPPPAGAKGVGAVSLAMFEQFPDEHAHISRLYDVSLSSAKRVKIHVDWHDKTLMYALGVYESSTGAHISGVSGPIVFVAGSDSMGRALVSAGTLSHVNLTFRVTKSDLVNPSAEPFYVVRVRTIEVLERDGTIARRIE
jgi:hypothetical protein